MATSPNLELTLTYLDELSQHNSKEWFDAHRPAYEAARAVFEQLVSGIIEAFRETDALEGLTAKECIARIYRDIRFSKDKSPYKANFGALVVPGGWKSSAHGYYIALEPHGRSMVAGGFYSPTPEELERFRDAIDTDAAAFKAIVRADTFADSFGTIEGERLKTAPKGYNRNHPEIHLLQLKQITAIHRFSDQEVLAPNFSRQVIHHCQAMQPFLKYLEAMLA